MAGALLSDPPEVSDLVNVFKEVKDWYTIGLKLDLPIDDLDTIKHNRKSDQIRKLFRLWLEVCAERRVKPSWQTLETVLDELHIHKPLQQIRRRYSQHDTLPAPPNQALPQQDDHPTIRELLSCSGDDQQVYKVIQEVASEWENLAYLLEMPQSIVDVIDRDKNKILDRCRQVFVEWLDGDYRRPVAWSTVLSVVEDLGHSVFALRFKEHCF